MISIPSAKCVVKLYMHRISSCSTLCNRDFRWSSGCPQASHSHVSLLAGADIAADFEDTPLLGQQEWRESAPYDAITCMFAIHYFFASEKAIKTFLHNVSINLKDGVFPVCPAHPACILDFQRST